MKCKERFISFSWPHLCSPHHTDGETEGTGSCHPWAPAVLRLSWALSLGAKPPAGFKLRALPSPKKAPREPSSPPAWLGHSFPFTKEKLRPEMEHPVHSLQLPRDVVTFLPLHRLVPLPGIFFPGHLGSAQCSGHCTGVTSSGLLPGWRARSGPDTPAR